MEWKEGEEVGRKERKKGGICKRNGGRKGREGGIKWKREREKEGEKERQFPHIKFSKSFFRLFGICPKKNDLDDNRMNCYHQNRNMYMSLQSAYLRKVIG